MDYQLLILLMISRLVGYQLQVMDTPATWGSIAMSDFMWYISWWSLHRKGEASWFNKYTASAHFGVVAQHCLMTHLQTKYKMKLICFALPTQSPERNLI